MKKDKHEVTPDYAYPGDDQDETALVSFHLTRFHQYRTRRINHETLWEEGSAVAWPEYRGSFTYGRVIAPGVKRSQYAVDSSIAVYSQRFASIADWLVTPQNLLWSRVGTSNPDLNKEPSVKWWRQNVSRILWSERYRAEANFVSQNSSNWHMMAVLGNMGMWTDELDNYLDPKERGLRYMSTPVGEIYIVLDHQKRVVGCYRHFRLNAQQAKTKFPKKVVPYIEAALAQGSQTLFDFLHVVLPRTDYNPFERLTSRGRKYTSLYICVPGHCVVEEGPGYRTLPLAYGRYMVMPEEDYGRGPTQIALSTIKTKNAQKRVFLKQGHRAGDPAYIVADTGLTSLQTHAGAWNAGLMSKDGKPLVGVLPSGEIQITEKMMEMEDGICSAAYLLDLFKLILEDPKGLANARAVVEYLNERGIILFPTIGRQNSEYLGPLIDRELDLLSWLRKLPPMPQVLREAGGEYQVEYTNAIALAMRGTQIAGYVRTMEFAGQAIQSGVDPSIFDNFDLDAALPEMGEWNMAPPEWFAGQKKIAGIRKGRQQAAERDRQVKELPGKAAIMKAQAISAKAATGGNTGGTLSGVPQGQMPLLPGQG